MQTRPPRHFWIQPPAGFTEATRGRSERELAAFEARVGYALPHGYRALMMAQNGGYVRASCLPGADFTLEELSPILTPEEAPLAITTFEDYLRLSSYQAQIDSLRAAHAFCDPTRLVTFALLHGHLIACFDYGWLQETAKPEPSIAFFSDDGEQYLHFRQIQPAFANFDELLSALTLPLEQAERTLVGIESSLGYSALITILQHHWQSRFEEKTDNRYGWFNFAAWHQAAVPLHLDDETLREYAAQNSTTFEDMLAWVQTEGRTRCLQSRLFPNQHQSGTYLFPDFPSLALIIEIPRTWFPSHRAVARLCDSLRSLPEVQTVLLINE
jgi:hypothetical protein